MMEPIRIFVGGTAEHDLPTRVLEHSIRRHTTSPVEIVRLWELGITIPEPHDRANRPRTSFSFQRFLIPEACGYTGRGIYLDSDMVCLTDIRELWESQIPEGLVCATPPGWQSAVMVIDCRRAIWKIGDLVKGLDDRRYGYTDLMNLKIFGCAKTISPGWNCTDRMTFESGGVIIPAALIHYTNMRRQPWLMAGHPHGDVWKNELNDAMANGVITGEQVMQSVNNHWVRPSLAPVALQAAPYPDSEFVPPNDLRK